MTLRRVVVEAAAKVNVGWSVGPRRPDGYHEVEGLIQTIALFDRIEIVRASDDAPLVTLDVPGHPELEKDSNLVVVAVQTLAERTAAFPVRVTLEKAIPVAAGLGGGSADAAGTLAGLVMLWGSRIPARSLAEIAAGIGSDVLPILRGGLLHVTGRGDVVRSVGSFDDGRLVLGVSGEGISAAAAYARFDEIGGGERTSLHHNDLEKAACDLVPGLPERLSAMNEATGVAFVSGSGPTVVGVVCDDVAADRAAAEVAPLFDRVVVVRPTERGVAVVPQADT